MFLLAVTLAGLIGISLGLLGSGGSIITLPVLVYVAGMSPHEAVGMSLLIVGTTSALGATVNLRSGNLDFQAALFFAVSGVLGALLGVRFTHLVSSRVLLLCFGGLMLITGAKMLLGRAPVLGRQCRPVRCLLVGVAVGILTGFLGVGGGFVILPALVLFAGLEMKVAVGTSLAIISVNSFAGLVGQLQFTRFNWPVTLAFLGAAMLGMVVGLALSSRVSARRLGGAFAWIIVVLGAFLVLKNSIS